MSFQNLRKNKDLISKLVNEAEKVGGGEKKNYGDDRVWKPTVDRLHVLRRDACIMFLISTLYLIQVIQITMVKYSYFSMVRKSLIRLWM